MKNILQEIMKWMKITIHWSQEDKNYNELINQIMKQTIIFKKKIRKENAVIIFNLKHNMSGQKEKF